MTGEEASQEPRLPELDEPIPPFPDGLRRVLDPAEEFTVLGRRARLRADGGEMALHTFAPPVTGRLRLAGARCTAAAALPAGLERRLAIGDAVIRERVLLARELPVLLIEWTAERETRVDLRWGLQLPAPEMAGALPNYSDLERGVLVRDGAAVALALSEPPLQTLDVRRGEAALAVSARVRLRRDAPVRLGIAIGADDAELRRLLRHIDRAGPLVKAFTGIAAKLSGAFSVQGPDPRLEEGVEWAKLRLAQTLVEWPDGDRSPVSRMPAAHALAEDDPALEVREALWIGLGLLAIGEHDAVRAILRTLGRLRETEGRTPSVRTMEGGREPGDADAEAAHLLLLARYHAWSGDHAFVREAWPRVGAAWHMLAPTNGAPDRTAPEGSTTLHCAALSALADTADSLGDPDAAADMRAAGGALPDPAAVPGVAEPLATACRYWAKRAAHGDADIGPPPWVGPTADNAADAVPAAAFLASLVDELLGAEPDAAVGRLTLRPRLPDWDEFRMSHLRVGPNHIGLAYHRDGDRHTFRLEPERGAVPIQVAFEPAVPGARLVAATVDGQPADLDARPDGDRVIVPVLLVLDDTRTVELRLDRG